MRMILSLFATMILTGSIYACPFCASSGQTLSSEVDQADFIVMGDLTNPQSDAGDITRGTTDLKIETVVKPHPYLAGRKMIVLPRYIPVDSKQGPTRYLVFCTLYLRPEAIAVAAVTSAPTLVLTDLSRLDAYRGEPVTPASQLGLYMKGAIENREKPIVERLQFFFKYLDAEDLTISQDAYTEFASADYPSVRKVAKVLPTKTLFDWLEDPNTLPSRYGLYGLLAGHCGQPEKAPIIRKLLDDPDRNFSSGLDGMLAAYIMLDKDKGWPYLMNIIKDAEAEFPVRYAGLKVLRFLWVYRPDLIEREKLLDAMVIMVGHSDMADLPIEDLREWQQWQLTDTILSFADKPDYKKVPIVQRAILRFALSAPTTNAKAQTYVAEQRKADPNRVKFIEELLKEEPATPNSNP